VKKIILCSALVSLLAACSSTPTKSDETSASAATSTQSAGTTTAPVTSGSTAATTSGATKPDPLQDPNNILAQRSVYFAFDQYLVDAKYSDLIQAHAAYLKNNPNAKVTLEGNADERGGAEYNLALGQKRAEAVRKQLSLLGASNQQMEAISFGKEKPKALGSNEAAWEQNRRTDINYQSK